MAMSLPRTWRISRSERSARFRPLNRTCPAVIFPGGTTSRMIDIAVTVFPEPDSPTSASASPFLTLKETLSTACTAPSAVKNDVRRFLTSSSASLGSTSASATRDSGKPTACDSTLTRAIVARSAPAWRVLPVRQAASRQRSRRFRKCHRRSNRRECAAGSSADAAPDAA